MPDDTQTTIDYLAPLLVSEADEALMLRTLSKCYGGSKMPLGFRVSAEHYRYLAEQIVALRFAQKRMREARAASEETARAKAT